MTQTVLVDENEQRFARRRIPLFEEYRAQFNPVRARYPFLVMEGKTQTAKTSLAKDIFGDPSEVRYVNAARCDEPDLRKFDFSKCDNNLHEAWNMRSERS